MPESETSVNRDLLAFERSAEIATAVNQDLLEFERSAEIATAEELIGRAMANRRKALVVRGGDDVDKLAFLQQLAGKLSRSPSCQTIFVASNPGLCSEPDARQMLIGISHRAAALLNVVPTGTLGVGEQASLEDLSRWVEVDVRQLAKGGRSCPALPVLLLVDLPARLDPGLASKRKLVDEFIFTPLAGIPGIFLVTTGWWLSQKLRCWADHWDFPCLTCDQTEALLAKIRPGQPLTDGSTAEEVFRASQGIASTVAVIARRGEVSAGLETIISAQLGDRWNSPPWRAVLDRLACLDHGLNDLSNPFQELEALLNNPVTGETLLPPGLLESLGEVRGACPLGRVIESLRKRGLLFWRGDDGWTFGHLGHLLQYQFQRRYPEHWEQLKLQAYDVFSQYEAKFQKSVWVSTIQHYRQQLLDAGISIPGEG